MKYLLLQETTDWDVPKEGIQRIPNHIYITDESKFRVFGYFPYPSHVAERFNKPMQFYTKGRKFKTLAKFDA